MKKEQLTWTGERFLPEIGDRMPEIYLEHLNRYYMAASLCRGKDVLDLASGEGYGSALLAREARSVVGVDLDPDAVAHASGKYLAENLRFLRADATGTGLPGGGFDLAVCFEAIEHVERQEALILEAKRLLREDGVLIVSTPNRFVHQREFHSENPFHVRELYLEEFRELLGRHFAHRAFYAQRVYQSARVWEMHPSGGGREEVSIRRFEGAQTEVPVAQRAPAFFLCVCSDRPLEGLQSQYELTDLSDMSKKLYEEKLAALAGQAGQNRAKAYFDTGSGFCEGQSVSAPYASDGYFSEVGLRLELPAGTRAVRVDPADGVCCVVRGLSARLGLTPLAPSSGNYAFTDGGEDWFAGPDPQYLFNPEGQGTMVVRFSVLAHRCPDFLLLADEARRRFREQRDALDNLEARLRRAREEAEAGALEEKARALLEAENEQARLRARLDELEGALCAARRALAETRASTCWRVTAPLRAAGGLLRRAGRAARQSRAGEGCAKLRVLLHKGMDSFEKDGLKMTLRRVKTYLRRQKEIRRFTRENGAEPPAQAPEPLRPYDSEYQDDRAFPGCEADVKALCFYLPQYHTFPENDAWWGAGFTEWTNTRKCAPRFEGHYQPRAPHADIGYYDLSDIETLRGQAALAKKHGIYGFCFYYYWFSGKRLMEKPVDLLLEHPEIDLPFCLCWANENWTRAWDGQSKQVLMAQSYADEDDPRFVDDLEKYLADPRYIRVRGRPVILVYNPGQIPDCVKTFGRWRERAREKGIGEILIWTCQTANNTAESLGITAQVDAEVEFPPHNMWHDILGVRGMDLQGKEANLYDYGKLVALLKKQAKEGKKAPVPLHRTAMLGWDNAARRQNGWTTFLHFSLRAFYDWMLLILRRAREDFPSEERFVFLNAWNEWAEGAYLEPDERYGYASINTASKALFGRPFDDRFEVVGPKGPPVREGFEPADGHVRIAVQVHLFYTDAIDEIIDQLNLIPYAFDCWISTDSPAKAELIGSKFRRRCGCREAYVQVLPNRGRDVAPMLAQMAGEIGRYDYFCHIHSKKTGTADYGDGWRRYLYQHLFGSREYLLRLFDLFEQDPSLGLIFPETYPVLQKQAVWGGNEEGVRELLSSLGIWEPLPSEPVFPVGNMFWARAAAIRPLFERRLAACDFPAEQGQVNATLAHQIERCWVYLARAGGYGYLKAFNNCLPARPAPDRRRIAFYVHYDRDNRLSDEDLRAVKAVAALTEEFVFITNSALDGRELDKLDGVVSRVLRRPNSGYDFGAWKEALFAYGLEKAAGFDQLLLLNNSCFAPVFDLGGVLAEMEERTVDFWGMTLFPESADGSYIGRERIREHLQSYFLSFTSRVVQSDAFRGFWEGIDNYGRLIEVVANCETVLTQRLAEAGFTYAAYVEESGLLCRELQNYAVPYELPVSLLLLRDPLVKKKCYGYMDDGQRVLLEWMLAALRDGGAAAKSS